MITPPDPFAQSFDSIAIERAPSPAAIESAFAAVGAGQPGFFLLDDADGRFIVDREMGVVMLRDDVLLEREHGAIHAARLRVVEPSGARYDLELKLRLTGRVPQMVGADDFGFAAETPAIEAPAPRGPHVAWAAYAAVRGLQTKPPIAEHGAYGALLQSALPPTREHVAIAFSEMLPAPAPAHAAWPV